MNDFLISCLFLFNENYKNIVKMWNSLIVTCMCIHISIIMENLKQVNRDLLIELGVSRG